MAKKIDDSLDVQSMTSETGMTSDNAQAAGGEGETSASSGGRGALEGDRNLVADAQEQEADRDVSESEAGGPAVESLERQIDAIGKNARRFSDALMGTDGPNVFEIVPEDEPPIMISVARAERYDSKNWVNQELPFDAFERKFVTPPRSKATVSYYKKNDGARKSAKREKGGFLGGRLKKDHAQRIDANLDARSFWNGDADNCTVDFFEKLKRGEGLNFRCFVYSSFSHTPEAPRIRIIAPFSRDVTPDEYRALAPFIALKIEHEQKCSLFDEHGNSPLQMMYNPYCPSDAEYFFKHFAGDVLDVDALLQEKTENEARLEKELAGFIGEEVAKTNTRAFEQRQRDPKKSTHRSDPRNRAGIPGAFNQAYYPIQKAIDKFLPHIYEKTGPDRYTFKAGSADSGLSIMDNLTAYSWHSTDPIGDGHAHDAFDIVCNHIYGGNRADAQRALKDDPQVKKQIYTARMQEVKADFPEFLDGEEDGGEWRGKLRIDDRAAYLATPDNCELILRNDPLFKNIALNEMAYRREIIGDVPWTRGKEQGTRFDDDDRAGLTILLNRVYEIDFSDRALDAGLRAISAQRRFHPFKDFLKALPQWDGKRRTAEVLTIAFDCDATAYTAAAVRKTLCAIIARAYEPGIKFDYVPVLDGDQGIGKTSFLKWLVGEQFYNGGITFEKMRSKSAVEDMQGYALCEFQELAGLSKVETRTARAFITETKDVYRAPYDREAKERLRVPIFWGTVNGYSGYLTDVEGNRRYLPLKCHYSGPAKWFKHLDENYRLQLWAEALQAYRRGESLRIDDDPALAAAALKAQNEALEIDSRAGLVERYLEIRFPTDWEKKNLRDRLDWLDSGALEDSEKTRGVRKEKVCVMEIYREALGGEAVRMARKDRDDIRRIMMSLPDWEPITGEKLRFGIHGQARIAWRRKKAEEVAEQKTQEALLPFTQQQQQEEGNAGEESGAEALELWRDTARAVTQYLTAQKQHQRAAGENVAAFAGERGIRGADLDALKNITRSQLRYAHGVSWGLENECKKAIRDVFDVFDNSDEVQAILDELNIT